MLLFHKIQFHVQTHPGLFPDHLLAMLGMFTLSLGSPLQREHRWGLA